jgi:putative nucleotidyltransferase with HDIG domain
VARLATAIADEVGLESERIEQLGMAAAIHDIGKIYVPVEILSKPGILTDPESRLLKNHTQAGHEIVMRMNLLPQIAETIWQHHERLDGSGYPRGLKGDEIMLEARMLAVADVVEAMMSHRPYRPALGQVQALAEIARGSGTLFDPEVCAACLRLFNEKGFTFTPVQ